MRNGGLDEPQPHRVRRLQAAKKIKSLLCPNLFGCKNTAHGNTPAHVPSRTWKRAGVLQCCLLDEKPAFHRFQSMGCLASSKRSVTSLEGALDTRLTTTAATRPQIKPGMISYRPVPEQKASQRISTAAPAAMPATAPEKVSRFQNRLSRITYFALYLLLPSWRRLL